jgi:nucleoside-diphosphate-sugar epimerase
MNSHVTGAAGSIGSHLCEHRLAARDQIRGLDAFTDHYPRADKKRNIAASVDREGFTLVGGDLSARSSRRSSTASALCITCTCTRRADVLGAPSSTHTPEQHSRQAAAARGVRVRQTGRSAAADRARIHCRRRSLSATGSKFCTS